MTSVKVEEINAVRDALIGQPDKDRSLAHFELVARWINSFSSEKSRLLEIGCGSGILGTYLKAQYAGIDPIEHKELCKDIEFKIGLGESIPYPDKSFDYILVKDAINYFADLDPVFSDASRALSDDGAILLTEFVGPRYHPLKQKLKNLVKKHLRIRRSVWDATYLNFYTSHDVMRAAARREFSISYTYVSAESRYYVIARKRH